MPKQSQDANPINLDAEAIRRFHVDSPCAWHRWVQGCHSVERFFITGKGKTKVVCVRPAAFFGLYKKTLTESFMFGEVEFVPTRQFWIGLAKTRLLSVAQLIVFNQALLR